MSVRRNFSRQKQNQVPPEDQKIYYLQAAVGVNRNCDFDVILDCFKRDTERASRNKSKQFNNVPRLTPLGTHEPELFV